MYKVLRKQFVLLLSFLYLAFALPFCKTSAEKVETDHKPKVSIIVPVYKVEPWLRECMDSLVNQTLKDIEIICVDDGSPDNCGKILDEYAKNDKRVKVIHQKNMGVSEARNQGLDIATGEYITFVDPDDYVEKKTYETAYNYAKKDDVDLLQFNFKIFENEKQIKFEQNDFSDGSIVPIEDFQTEGMVWQTFFKSDLINKINLSFIKRGIFEEDYAFVFSYVPHTNKIKKIPGTFYYYRSHRNNTCKTENKSWQIPSRLKLIRHIKNICQKSKIKNDKPKILSMLMHSPFVNHLYRHNAKKVLKTLGRDLYNKKVIKKCPKDVQELIRKFEKKARVKKSLVN